MLSLCLSCLGGELLCERQLKRLPVVSAIIMRSVIHSLLFIVIFSLPAFAQIKPVAVTMPGNNVDSLAIWIAPNKADSLVLLTEKGGGSVLVFKADARATFVRRFGQMKRPNGAAMLPGATIGTIRNDVVFITDRDANICYIYSVPEFELLGTFADDLQQPMGVTTYRRATDGAVFAYIVQKRGEGDAKVIRYRIVEENGKLNGQRELQFGHELTVNQETVMVDAERELVYVADETARDIKVYNLDGKFQRSFGKGIFQAQVEGIVVASCGDKGNGYIIASDQRRATEFEFFDRVTFKHLGTIKGTAKITDGIALSLASLPDYPNGLFIAQSDPQATGGRHAEFYDFGQMLKRLKLLAIKCH